MTIFSSSCSSSVCWLNILSLHFNITLHFIITSSFCWLKFSTVHWAQRLPLITCWFEPQWSISIKWIWCITLYSQKWTVWPWEAIFCKKNCLKNSFLGRHESGSSDFGGGWDPQFEKYQHFQHVSWKAMGISFQMSYREARWRQYCPNGGPLLSLGGGDTENCKKMHFFLLSLLLENFVKKNSTRIGPCESSRPELSENV